MNRLILFVLCILVLGSSAMRLRQIDSGTAEIINAINRNNPASSQRFENDTTVDEVAWLRCCAACQRDPFTTVQCIGR